MAIQEFEAKEKNILEGILQKGIIASKKGFVSKLPKEGKQASGYIILLRYGDGVNSKIEQTSNRIKKICEGNAIVYGRKNVHQTISDFEIGEYDEGMFVPDEEVLKSLSGIAYTSFIKYNQISNQEPLTVFGNYIPSDDSVIQRPIQNLGNCELINLAVEASQNTGTPIKGTWGRHITISRFKKDLSKKQSQKVGEFLFDEYGLKQSFPSALNDGDIHFAKSLDVCALTASRKNGFKLETYESFKF